MFLVPTLSIKAIASLYLKAPISFLKVRNGFQNF